MFPQRSKWLGCPVGWKDLGEIDYSNQLINGEIIRFIPKHPLCNRRLKVGKENGKLFKFCPRCEVKFEE